MGNATPGSAVVITLLAAPFIKAQEKGIKAAHVCSLTKPLGAPRGYGIPVRGSRCPARSGYGRPRSQAPGPRARLYRPGSTRVPSRLSATPPPSPRPTYAGETTQREKRRAGSEGAAVSRPHAAAYRDGGSAIDWKPPRAAPSSAGGPRGATRGKAGQGPGGTAATERSGALPAGAGTDLASGAVPQHH